MARTKKQMIGVAEDDFGVEIVLQVALEYAFDRRLRADRHEDRRLDVPVRRVQNPGSRTRFGADREQLKTEQFAFFLFWETAPASRGSELIVS
jgi:hypothetical protein